MSGPGPGTSASYTRPPLITPGTTPSVIANHLAAVAAGPWRTATFQSPHPSQPNLSPPRTYSQPRQPISPPNTQLNRSPTAESLQQRAAVMSPDIVIMRELETSSPSERGSPLRLDDAIIATTRARDESERVLAEVIAGIERSFQPHDDKRLVCRAYVAQLARTIGRLRDATARLERESADCLRHSATDRAELQSKLYHQKVQAQGHAKLLKSELERVEAERQAHADQLNLEFERLRRGYEDESARLGSDVSHLQHSLDASRAETASIWQKSQQQQSTLTKEVEALRNANAQLIEELESCRDVSGADAATLRTKLIQLEADKRATAQRLVQDNVFITQLASDTQANLEAQLTRLSAEKEATIAQMRAQLFQLQAQRDGEVGALEAALEHLGREKESSELRLRNMMQRKRVEWEEEAAALRGKVHRLMAVQKAAMDAPGHRKAHEILYWNHVKGDGSDASLTWRAADETLGSHGDSSPVRTAAGSDSPPRGAWSPPRTRGPESPL